MEISEKGVLKSSRPGNRDIRLLGILQNKVGYLQTGTTRFIKAKFYNHGKLTVKVTKIRVMGLKSHTQKWKS